MSASPQSTTAVPTEPGTTTSAGVEATQEVQATDNLPQEGVNETEEQEEEDAPRQRLAFPPRPDKAPTALVPTVHAEESDEESDDDGLAHLAAEDSGSGSDNDEEEAYVPATETSAAKIPKFKKKKSKGGDDVGTNGEKKEKKKSKSKRVEKQAEPDAEDEDMEPTYDEATRVLSLFYSIRHPTDQCRKAYGARTEDRRHWET
jgi:transcription factor SPN1